MKKPDRNTAGALLASAAVSGLLLLALPMELSAQKYPAKTVRLIVPFPAGGGTDVQARVLVKEFQDQLGQNFIVDNRAGASGLVGAELVVNAPPDGYTFLFTTATISIVPTLYGGSMKFQPSKDLQPVSWVSTTPLVLVVHPSVPAKSPHELIALGRAKSGVLNAAINVAGSTSHLSAEMFKQLGKLTLTTVPYKGGGLSMVAVMGGEVDFQFAEAVLASPQIRAAKIRALAVTTPKPSEFFPGLPTMNSILPGFVSDNWFAMFFPARTPKEIVSTINGAIRKALDSKSVRAFLAQELTTGIGSTPEELEAHIKLETARYGEIIRKSNITLQ